MANTYTQLYIQLIFAVQGRQSLVQESFRIELEKYITGIIQNRKHKMIAIYCNPDHSHICVGLNPWQAISDLVKDIKSNSTKFIHEKKFLPNFYWQEGYGAFSYSRADLNNVVQYILNQPKHHEKKKFREEYIEFLKEFQIDYDEKYLFKWID